MTKFDLTRRGFLSGLSMAAGGLVLGPMLPRQARAQAAAGRKFVFAYFEGGWDQLLGLDPRDPNTTNAVDHKIEPAYNQLGAYAQRGVQTAGNLSFGPAVPAAMLAHADKCSIIRAIGMDTAAHEVGRRYFITGQFPRGIAAVGSSAAAHIVAQQGDNAEIPFLAAGVEAYARELPSFASPLAVSGIGELLVALQPFVAIDPAVRAAVVAYQDEAMSCGAKRLNRDGSAQTMLENQRRARRYIEGDLGSLFDLQRIDPNNPQYDANLAALATQYGIVGGDSFRSNSPEMLAFAAGQALKNNVSQSVAVRLAEGLDTHGNDWAQDHAQRQERGWNALAALITDLSDSGELANTTILVFSEFARTPLLNNLQGRDHFLGNSSLILGAGIKPGQVIGTSAEVGMMPLFTRLSSGEGIAAPPQSELDSGTVVTLSPKHVLATVFAAADLDYSHLRVDPISALLA